MRRRRHLAFAPAVVLLAIVAVPSAADATMPVGVAPGIPSVTSSQHPFISPRPRPNEAWQRPTDEDDPSSDAYKVPEAPRSPSCTPHFCVHWVAESRDAPSLADGDGDGIPDYVESVQQVAEYARAVENEQLGWREPKSDGRRGGGEGKTDIFLSQLGGELFGYAAPDPKQAEKGRIPRQLYAYLVIDNDYSAFEFPGTDPLEDLQVTLAHEYNHVIQFGYDAYQDPWFAEATATWMEEQVYPEVDDYLNYVRRWGRLNKTPLTATTIKEYGSAVWNHWLAGRYGPELVRRAWATAIRIRPGGFSVGAYDAAIREAGGSTFSRDFARFATAVAEWRTEKEFGEGGRYRDVSRQGRLPLDGQRLTRQLDHTTFQLLRVPAEGGRAVVVKARAPRGTAAGLALVGRLGSERGGEPVQVLDFSRGGGKLRVRLPDPGRFSRVTAVLVNADASTAGFSAYRLDWLYLTDQVPFEVSGRVAR